MRYIWKHIQTVVDDYNGAVPLTHYLRTYFKRYPVLGSRDRKMLSEMAYSWYRCSRGFTKELPFETIMQACLFLCSNNLKLIHALLPAQLIVNQVLPMPERLNLLNGYLLSSQNSQPTIPGTGRTAFSLKNIFPDDVPLSEGIDKYAWLQSILYQPRLFIRIRKNKDHVAGILTQAGIDMEWLNDNCISLPNSTAVDKLLPADCYVVQDASSQAAAACFEPKSNQNWWDCCSGAGGKSLYLLDKKPSVQLTVSDIRDTILKNLQERFRLYGHKPGRVLNVDTSDHPVLEQQMGSSRFAGIICDVPCTGSGTWARTPEQMFFFDPKQLTTITSVQKKILGNAASYLQPGGIIYYITCSIFRQENEDIVDHVISRGSGLSVRHIELINGLHIKADSMFIAVIRRD